MPFISKDWRSPGEEWVKTQEGWEKKKVLECTSSVQFGDHLKDKVKLVSKKLGERNIARPCFKPDHRLFNYKAQVRPHQEYSLSPLAWGTAIPTLASRPHSTSSVLNLRRPATIWTARFV
ncbi:hypothetical protein EVAR_12422_1 [Eumeta japonica]|uniref:Uncharacterized protein n=1 Tax=Eumeta variegata TaxID=151549 RepID=A0A4C1TZ74_EUMVA|nr:hypothetical protein EVAR_12422_1 [Eumeta japonica]